MSSDTPVTVAVATYNNKASAEQDYDAIRSTKHHGQLDHIAIAFVEKDTDGRLEVARHDSTAKHLAWGGGVLGASLAVVSAPLGIVFLGPLAATTAVWAGVGGFVGHFHHNIPKDEVRKMSDVLETGQFGLVVVAINPNGTNVEALLANAVESVVSVDVADPAGALADAFETVADDHVTSNNLNDNNRNDNPNDNPNDSGPDDVKSAVAKKSFVALATVGLLVLVFAVCLISAVQLLAPRDMPFGVTASSPVVDAVQQEYSLDLTTYSSEADLMAAAERGDIYGGYVVGSSSDVLVTVPAKSFFGEVYVSAGFKEAAKTENRTYTTTPVAPLPTADRTGALVGLLLLPTLVGGYMIASLMFSTSQIAAARGRIAIVLAFAVAVALITGIAAGPLIGAFPTSHLWTLVPCFFLVTAVVGLSAVAIQALVGKLGSLVVALLFVIIGGAGAGGGGVALLPTYWQYIGALFPPRHAIELYRNVRYFDGNNIAIPIAVLLAYGLVSLVVIVAVTRRSRPVSEPALPDDEVAAGGESARPDRRRLVPKNLIAPVAFSLILTTLFAVNYMASGHEPIADNMPFGVVGPTELAEAAQSDLFDLDITQYDDQDAATEAMDRGEIYGALITSDSSTELMVVNTISDISPLDIAGNFEEAAVSAGETISVKAYAPTPLAAKDPFALVPATLLVVLLIGGYMSAALLATAVGSASARGRGAWLAGFAVVTGLLLDIVTTYWLDGFPEDSFWVAWPILSLIILVVALFAAVMRRLLGPAGIVVTLIVILQFGNPSSGGSNGAAYLTPFWDGLGPFLPPRNAFLLLRNTLYFDGNGIAQPLFVLLAYAIIGAVILGFLDWYRSPELSVPGLDGDDATQAAGVAIPVGPLP